MKPIIKKLLAVLFAGMLCAAAALPVFATTNKELDQIFKGSGTKNDPYQITSTQEFDTFRSKGDIITENDHFILTEDITVPMESMTKFSGTLDGNGHTMHLNRQGTKFTIEENYGTVKNLRLYRGFGVSSFVLNNYGTLENISADWVTVFFEYRGEYWEYYNEDGSLIGVPPPGGKGRGILVDVNQEGGLITYCMVRDCNISPREGLTPLGTGGTSNQSEYSYGGIAGTNYGTIQRSVNNYSHVFCEGNAGGIVGLNYATVASCWVTNASIEVQKKAAGGIVGSNGTAKKWGEEIKIVDCAYSNASTAFTVEAGEGDVGGIAGFNNGRISDVFTNYTVANKSSIQGLIVGWQKNAPTQYAAVQRAYVVKSGEDAPFFGADWSKGKSVFNLVELKAEDKAPGNFTKNAKGTVTLGYFKNLKFSQEILFLAPGSSGFSGSVFGGGNLFILIGAAVVLAGGGVAFVIIKKKKNKPAVQKN